MANEPGALLHGVLELLAGIIRDGSALAGSGARPSVDSNEVGQGPEAERWTCRSCSAANEPGFDLCWSCGAERAGGK